MLQQSAPLAPQLSSVKEPQAHHQQQEPANPARFPASTVQSSQQHQLLQEQLYLQLVVLLLLIRMLIVFWGSWACQQRPW